MKSLKLTLAATFIAASAFVVANAAEALLSPRTTANATATAAPRPVVGSPRGLATLPATPPPAATTDATAHCKTPEEGPAAHVLLQLTINIGRRALPAALLA